jgi:hypothetical protein
LSRPAGHHQPARQPRPLASAPGESYPLLPGGLGRRVRAFWNAYPHQGRRPGLTTDERQRLKQLERENFERRRANEILKKASAYFAQAELDRRPK